MFTSGTRRFKLQRAAEMHCFELIRKVLDDAYGDIPGTDDEKDVAIRNELARLTKKYTDLRKYANIDYSSPVTRFAYVFKYVTSHANIVATLISYSPELGELLKSESVHVTCIGGGPGSDLLGILKYLEERKRKVTINAEVYDGETAWADTWSGLFSRVDPELRVRQSFNFFNVTDERTWRKLKKYLDADLFTMIYFMSEVYGLRNDAELFFQHLFEKAKKGALFLFVDNRKSNSTHAFRDWFDELASNAGMEVLLAEEGDVTAPPSEEKTALGVYYEKFGAPKIRSNVAWRVVRRT